MAYSDRAEVTDLRTLLRDPDVQKDQGLYLKAVRKVIASMTLGVDVSSLFTEMIKAGDTVQVVQKKMVYLYLSCYGKSNPDLALLTLNTLRKDLDSHNAMIRGLALRTLSSLSFTEVVKYLPEALQHGLNDSNSYVRKSAVMGVVKLFYANPEMVDKMNFVDVMYQMLRDRDAQVVSNCIAALSEILAAEGGMVLNTKIAHYLLNRLDDFCEWGQNQIMELLLCYQVTSEKELFDILNILDVRLKSANSGVVLAATRLFLHFTANMAGLQDHICERVRNPMLTFACIDYIEIAYVFLVHAQLMLAKFPQMWRRNYQSFYFRVTDPLFIKVKKIDLLDAICMFESVQHITSELSIYVTDSSPMVAKKSIQALASIAQKIPSKANTCVDQLLPHLSCQVDHTMSETLVALTSILRKFDNMLEYVLPKLPRYSILSESRGKAALIWILGEYGEHLPETPYVLEKVIEGVAEESSPEVRVQLLSAVMKMFFKRPPECQEMLGRLLEYTINEDSDMDVRDRALLYYRLLRGSMKIAKKVVCGEPKLVELHSASDKELLLPEFNTLAVMFGKPSSKFIEQKFPYIKSTNSTSTGAETSFEVTVGGVSHKGREEVLALNSEATISPTDFERKWKDLNVAKELHIHVERLLPQDQFIKQLSSHHIQNMAASPPQHKLVKYYFFAQETSTQSFFLLEVDTVEENLMMSCLLKSDSPQKCSWFIKQFLKVQNLSGESSSLLDRKTCSDIPTGMSSASGAFYQNQLYVSGHTSCDKADSMLYAYSPDVDIWKVLPPCPLKWFTIAVWRDQLVLLGGMEASNSPGKAAVTRKVIVWKDGKWVAALPPMIIPRVSPTVVADGHYLAVTGGRKGYLGKSIEVLDSKALQWYMVPSLPIQSLPHTFAICNNMLYLLHSESGRIIQASVSTFLRQKEENSNSDTSFLLEESSEVSSINSEDDEMDVGTIWSSVPKPPIKPLRIASIGGYIVVFSPSSSQGSMDIHGYFPETDSWWLVGTTPTLPSSTTCVCSPHKQLYLVGGASGSSQFSQKLYQAAFTKSV